MSVHRSTETTDHTGHTHHHTSEETSMTAVDAVPTDTAFSTRVKSQTQDAHDEAENSPFMGDLLEGSWTGTPMSHCSSSTSISTAPSRRRRRGSRTRRSSRACWIRAWTASPPSRPTSRTCGPEPLRAAATPATGTYVDRLAALPQDAPERYFAHHYLRYLGDLSGGQVIGRLAVRHYSTCPRRSLRTWRFEGIEKHKPYKDQYRAALDAAPLTEAQRDAFVDEARAGFILAKELFDSLA